MSVRVRSSDGSEEKLLDGERDPSNDDEENEEDREESLASLLGISDHHVIDLETDDDNDDTENDKCETIECVISDDEEDDKAKGSGENIDATDVVSDGDNEDVPVPETHSNSGESKKEDFEKLFRQDLQKRSVRVSEQVAGTSSSNDAGAENKSYKAGPSDERPLIPPQEQPSTSRSISKPARQVSKNLRFTELQKRQRKLLMREVSQRGKICCAIVIFIILCSMSVGLIGLAWRLGLEDLYIVGGIFGAGAVLFVIIFIFIRCTAKTQDRYYSTFYKI